MVRKIIWAVIDIVIVAVAALAVFELFFSNPQTPNNPSVSTLRVIQTIPLPNTNGRIDHMGINPSTRQLFVACLGNNSLAVIDLNSGNLTHSIAGLNQPQGVGYIPTSNKIYVSNAGNGDVNIYGATTFASVGKIALQSDADNIRYDSTSNLLYVGYGQGGIAVISPNDGKQVGNIDLGNHPEGFQVEQNGSRIFVNVPSAGNYVAVFDRKTNATTAKWSLAGQSENFPMALDEAHHRLFVGTRTPPKLIVLDTESGNIITSVDISQDPDDVFYNANNGYLYVSCGQGSISVIKQVTQDNYESVASVSTASGARTSLLSLELNQFYVAVPQSLLTGAEVLVYQVASPNP